MGNDEEKRRSRRGSYYTQDEKKTGGRRQQAKDQRSSASYKADLERLFSGSGEVPERFKDLSEKLEPEAGTPEAERAAAIEGLRTAEDFRGFVQAVNEFLKKGYALPDDEELLIRMLDHPSERVLSQVLAHLVDLHGRRGLQRRVLLGSRLDSIRVMTDDPQILRLVDELASIG